MMELSYKMFFRAFSNETRFKIISLLRKNGPQSVNDICKKLGFEQSRVSHNLKSLVACGFVHRHWEGKKRIYLLDKKYIVPILCNMDKHIKKYSIRLDNCGVLKGKKSCQFVREV